MHGDVPARWASTRSSCIGGDGTLAIAHEFYKKGIPLVGVPKTIDNDIVGTTSCFGFDTAVSFATDAIDRLHTTAEAHRRIMVVEVMGRYAGWIALHARRRRRRRRHPDSGDSVRPREGRAVHPRSRRLGCTLQHRRRRGGRACREDGAMSVIAKAAQDGQPERLGGAGLLVAKELEARTGKETRSVVLGHLQRGGAPTAFDRMLATRFGGKAVELRAGGRVRRDGGESPAGYRARAAWRSRGEDTDRAARLRPGAHGEGARRVVRRLTH